MYVFVRGSCILLNERKCMPSKAGKGAQMHYICLINLFIYLFICSSIHSFIYLQTILFVSSIPLTLTILTQTTYVCM